MKLASVRHGDRTHAARLEGDGLVLLPHSDVGALLADPEWSTAATVSGPSVASADVQFLPVVPRPDKIVCLGLNYATHILETGRETPRFPTLFAKFAAALTGAYAELPKPTMSDQLDWEAELAVVIGRGGKDIPVDRALDHVGGYTVANDVSVRDYQRRSAQYLAGKTFEALTPLGPFLVTPDQVPPGASGLRISCLVDGEVMQDSTTADLLFDVAHVVHDLSTIITLLPGDVILTGTPGGVGVARSPQVFLQPGQVLETVIEGIGRQRNVVR